WKYTILDEQNKAVEIIAAYAAAVDRGAVHVPETITKEGLSYNVQGIGENVFRENKNITSVVIENRIRYIGSFCFRGCSNLTELKLPNKLQEIGDNAFNSCSSLSDIEIPDTVMKIERGAFWYTPWLNNAREEREDHLVIRNHILIDGRMATGDVVVPDDVTYITGYSFYGPDSILKEITNSGTIKGGDVQSITIPSSVKRIEQFAFYYCNKLIRLEMAEGITTLGREAFSHCTSLSDVRIPSTLTDFAGGVFWYTPWLDSARNEREDHLVIRNNILMDGLFATGDLVLPDEICEILPCCFYAPNCYDDTSGMLTSSSMTSITIPDSVTKIGFRAFTGCLNLKQVRLPRMMTDLGHNCFNGCTSLTDISIPDSVKLIQKGTFGNCTALMKIVLPESIQEMDGTAIDDVETLTLVIPEKMTDIGSLNLLRFKNVNLCVVADGSVDNYLKENQFTHYTTYASSASKPVDPDSDANNQPAPGNPEADKQPETKVSEQTTEQTNTAQQENKIGTEYTVKGCRYKVLDGKNVTFSGVEDSSAAKLTIPSYVKVNGVAYKVTRIEDGACKGMTRLKSVFIGGFVTKIGRQAFMNCKSLKKVQIGKRVTSIEKQAFYGDRKLKEVVIKSTKLKKIGKKGFSDISKKARFKVPIGKGNAYKRMIKRSRK
ncbi:MAG: leucine-rich repeat domain-containing protein, partial [Lachnospiraceae bacterium]|nr:leucine-rich repeat domain-containing protein [Lachnospiraceae bacterium]